jgi:hypothetical protein
MLTDFLESNNIPYQRGSLGAALSAPDLADAARNVSVFIVCQ